MMGQHEIGDTTPQHDMPSDDSEDSNEYEGFPFHQGHEQFARGGYAHGLNHYGTGGEVIGTVLGAVPGLEGLGGLLGSILPFARGGRASCRQRYAEGGPIDMNSFSQLAEVLENIMQRHRAQSNQRQGQRIG